MPTPRGRRRTWGVLVGLMLAVLPPTGAAPAPSVPLPARPGAWSCSGDLDEAPRRPVLLVPGTGLTPRQNYGPTYLPVLRDRGHPVCLVRLPARGTADVQRNAAHVGAAIEAMAERAGRRVSVIGHSQGALLPLVALRTWPRLARRVDDVIGIAGVYDRGSSDLVRRCARSCLPALHQMATGSRLLGELSRRRLPAGPSYTNIGVAGDRTVTPQPRANRLPGAVSVMVQRVCPLHVVPEPQHAMIIGDAVALALVLDALDHRGTASPRRIDAATCLQGQYPAFDEEAFLEGATTTDQRRLALPTSVEPRVWCRYRPGCDRRG